MDEQKLAPIDEDGKAFLKVATAAPDFESVDLRGIPDGHSGPSVCVKNYVTTTITAPAGEATYVLATPQCGVAVWFTSVPTGSDWQNGQDIRAVPYPKASQVFGSINTTSSSGQIGGSNSNQVSKGRCVSSAAELEVLNNAFNQYGSITAWKVPLNLVQAVGGLGAGQPGLLTNQINGISGCTSQIVGSTSYTSAVKQGVYSVSMNREDQFDWFPVRDGENRSTVHEAFYGLLPGAAPGIRANFNGPMALWDNNFDTIVFRIDVPAGTDVVDQSFLLKRWTTFELQPVFNSLLYDTAHLSPERDEACLAIYRELCRNLPMAVPRKDNPDFWQTMLSVIDEVSNVLSYVPGPIGLIAKGVHGVGTMLSKRPKGRKGKTTGKRVKGRKKKKKRG